MRVKLCARCPYTPRDLAHHYDPKAALYACATCDNEQDPCVNRWRRTCSTEMYSSSAAEPSAAPFAAESSASSAIIARGPRSVPGSASTTSRHDAIATPDGCGAFASPDGIGEDNADQFPPPPAFIDRETVC
jgi:hypothetical protein